MGRPAKNENTNDTYTIHKGWLIGISEQIFLSHIHFIECVGCGKVQVRSAAIVAQQMRFIKSALMKFHRQHRLCRCRRRRCHAMCPTSTIIADEHGAAHIIIIIAAPPAAAYSRQFYKLRFIQHNLTCSVRPGARMCYRVCMPPVWVTPAQRLPLFDSNKHLNTLYSFLAFRISTEIRRSVFRSNCRHTHRERERAALVLVSWHELRFVDIDDAITHFKTQTHEII